MERTIQFFNNAKIAVDLVGESSRPQDSDTPEFMRIIDAVSNLRKRGEIRLLTRINDSNLAYVKELLSSGLISEVRSLDDLKGNFAISVAISSRAAARIHREMEFNDRRFAKLQLDSSL